MKIKREMKRRMKRDERKIIVQPKSSPDRVIEPLPPSPTKRQQRLPPFLDFPLPSKKIGRRREKQGREKRVIDVTKSKLH